MSECLEKLKEIGAQKIHEHTHIAHKHVQAILHESYEDMQKIQLFGFISILEREYGCKLEELRKNANEYFEAQTNKLKPAEDNFKDYQKSYSSLYIIVFFLLIILGAFYMYNASQTQKIDTESKPIETKIEKTIYPEEEEKPVIKSDSNETNKTDINTTKNIPSQITKPQEIKAKKEVELTTLKILPKTKVWVGYIDLENNKKHQTTTSKPISLDPKKDYLLVFGHGYIDIETSKELYNFKKAGTTRFLYKDGELKEIDVTKFKELNKGKQW